METVASIHANNGMAHRGINWIVMRNGSGTNRNEKQEAVPREPAAAQRRDDAVAASWFSDEAGAKIISVF
jgi:hypothetical protein